MANRCINCDKGVKFGHNVSHAKNRTNRPFKANIHKMRVKIGEHFHRLKLCTKCTRMIKQAAKSFVSGAEFKKNS